jgi:hypothetical protein
MLIDCIISMTGRCTLPMLVLLQFLEHRVKCQVSVEELH